MNLFISVLGVRFNDHLKSRRFYNKRDERIFLLDQLPKPPDEGTHGWLEYGRWVRGEMFAAGIP